MAHEITYTKKVELDGGAIRLYASQGGNIAPELEYVAIYLEAGDVESKITIRDFGKLKELRDACDEALQELTGGRDVANDS